MGYTSRLFKAILHKVLFPIAKALSSALTGVRFRGSLEKEFHKRQYGDFIEFQRAITTKQGS